jgi:hypothetical protein
MPEAVVDDKTAGEVSRRAAGVISPFFHHGIEIDVEHDPAEVEQQDVDGGGGRRQIHGTRLQNCDVPINGRSLA